MLRHRKIFRTRPSTQIGQEAFVSFEQSGRDEGFEDITEIFVPTCNGCSRVIHDPKGACRQPRHIEP